MMDAREYCPACYMHLGTSLTTCACGWKMLDPMPRQDLELPPPVGFVSRAEHDRIVAEKDTEIARLREALQAQLAEARDKALEDAARRLLRCFPNMGMIDEFAAEIRALKESPDA